MKNLLSVALVFFFSCAPVKNSESQLNDDPVTLENGVLVIPGFIVSGYPREHRQQEAIQSWQGGCSHLERLVYGLLDRVRIRDLDCGDPENFEPWEPHPGIPVFMYRSRPTLTYAVNSDDEISAVDGDDIEGEEAPNYSLGTAFRSFNELCFAKMEELKRELGTRFVVASCGDAVVHRRMVFSEDHGFEVPRMRVTSRMKYWVRAAGGAQPTEQIDARLLTELQGQSGLVFDVVFTRDRFGYSPVTVDSRGSVAKWNLRDRAMQWRVDLRDPTPLRPGDERPLIAVAASADGRSLIVGGDHGFLAHLGASDGRLVRQLDTTSERGDHYCALQYEEDGRTALSGSLEMFRFSFGGSYNDIRLPSQPVRTYSAKLKLWDMESGEVSREMSFSSGEFLSVGYAPESHYLYAVSVDAVRVFDRRNGSLYKEITREAIDPTLRNSFITGASFSPDRRLLAVATFSGVNLIDTETHELQGRMLAQLDYPLGNPQFMEDMRTVRAADAFGNFFEWELGTRRLVRVAQREGATLGYNGRMSMPASYSPDQRWLVFGSVGRHDGQQLYFPPAYGIDTSNDPERPDPADTGIQLWEIR